MRHLWLWVAALALTAGWAGGAFAQTNTMTAFPSDTEVTVNGSEAEQSNQYVYLNKAQCGADNGTPIVIKMPMRTSAPSVVEVWVGEGTVDCSKGDNRNKTSTDKANCREITEATEENPTQRPTASSKATDLFDAETDGKCKDGTYWVYVLALSSPSTETENKNVDTADYRRVHFTVDTIAPGAPTGLKTRNGETEVTLSWKLPDDLDNEPLSKVWVYWDPMGIAPKGDACSSDALVAGKKPGAGVESEKISRAEEWRPSPSKLGLDVDEQIPVAVAAVDEAGNAGLLSDVKCVAYEEVDGFCDKARGDATKGCGEDFDTCSARPWRGAASLSGLFALSLATLLIARRRRRSF